VLPPVIAIRAGSREDHRRTQRASFAGQLGERLGAGLFATTTVTINRGARLRNLHLIASASLRTIERLVGRAHQHVWIMNHAVVAHEYGDAY
jgi:hypothetical protein